jgi:predicted phosphodiesterase
LIAIISDIHGNLPALEAVIEHITARGATRIWCLGDTTGYGASPSACLARVRSACEVVLSGNHDLAVAGDERMSQAAVPGMYRHGPGEGIALAQAQLTPDEKAYLASLPSSVTLDHVELIHGSRRDPLLEYVRTRTTASAHMHQQQVPLSCVGHSHEQLVFAWDSATQSASGGPVRGSFEYVLTPGVKHVINPGSVGQPRDGDPRAAWALLQRGVITFERTEYDVEQAVAAIIDAGLPSANAERLRTGTFPS